MTFTLGCSSVALLSPSRLHGSPPGARQQVGMDGEGGRKASGEDTAGAKALRWEHAY